MKGKLRKINTFIIVLISSLFAGCEDNHIEEKVSLVTQGLPTNEYPYGYSDVLMGSHILRVPKEIAAVRVNGHFTVLRIWPEFSKPVNSSRSTTVKVFIDKIKIFFRPPRRNSYSLPSYEQGRNARERKLLRLLNLKGKYEIQESIEFPGYWAYLNGFGKPEAYIAKDTSIIGPQGLPIVFSCSTFNLDIDWDSQTEIKSFPQCGYTAYWDDGHSISVRFHRKYMQDAIHIYKKIMTLHNTMIIKKA
jgi:hypothetical protein